MTNLSDENRQKKDLLKHMILQLHGGEAPAMVKSRLAELLGSIPYDDVVEVEQELIADGLPVEEVLKFCDIHQMVLEGKIDQGGGHDVPEGHPVDTFKKENRELQKVIRELDSLFSQIRNEPGTDISLWSLKVRTNLNSLMDVNKHYLKKEYLVFPFLEKYEITGPPKVMWGKHDEIRELLKASIEALSTGSTMTAEEARTVSDLVLIPAVKGVSDMIAKEEEILFPMCLDRFTPEDWYSVYQQTGEFGYCLYDPQVEWKPEGAAEGEVIYNKGSNIHLSTGTFALNELEALFKTLPIDVTFVDSNDKVKFFSLGADRIFPRNRAIIGRDVRMCHPPSSVHVVEKILDDFRNNRENSAVFWISMHGRFIYIEYFALRDKQNQYLGTIEFVQDLTEARKLQGEQRLLSYKPKQNDN